MKDISRWIRSREKLRSIFQSTYASRSEGIAVSAHHLRADFNLSQLLSLMRPKRSLANCRLYLSEISSIIERHHAQLMELPHDALAAVVKRKKGSDSLVTFRRGTDGFYAAEEPIAIEQATPLSADTILLLPSQRR